MTQRDKMRQLFAKHHQDEDATVLAYAGAEQESQVHRKNNAHNMDSLAYANALLRDAIRRGWLK
jgi:hypothetical protein